MKKAESALLNETNGASAAAHTAGSARRVLRVWVVEDDEVLRQLYAELLSQQPGIGCRRQFPSAEALLATLAEERPPDLILMDVNLGAQSGLSAIRPIKRLAPSVKVVMMTMFTNSDYELEAFRAGASGFVLKSYGFEEIVRLIHEAHRNPGSPALFRNLPLNNQAEPEVELEEAGGGGSGGRFGLVGAIRRLCVGGRRQTAI